VRVPLNVWNTRPREDELTAQVAVLASVLQAWVDAEPPDDGPYADACELLADVPEAARELLDDIDKLRERRDKWQVRHGRIKETARKVLRMNARLRRERDARPTWAEAAQMLEDEIVGYTECENGHPSLLRDLIVDMRAKGETTDERERGRDEG
jgi:hypothetical protein